MVCIQYQYAGTQKLSFTLYLALLGIHLGILN